MEEAAAGAGHPELDTYFAMARGAKDAPAMEMTKWFDTNYHYIVPEFHKGQTFRLSSRKAARRVQGGEGARHRHAARAHRAGHLPACSARSKGEEFDPLSLLDALLPVYAELLGGSQAPGRDWVQIDEPCWSLDLVAGRRSALCGSPTGSLRRGRAEDHAGHLFRRLRRQPRRRRRAARRRPARRPRARPRAARRGFSTTLPPDRVLSLGVVDGRNIWRTDLATRST